MAVDSITEDIKFSDLLISESLLNHSNQSINKRQTKCPKSDPEVEADPDVYLYNDDYTKCVLCKNKIRYPRGEGIKYYFYEKEELFCIELLCDQCSYIIPREYRKQNVRNPKYKIRRQQIISNRHEKLKAKFLKEGF